MSISLSTFYAFTGVVNSISCTALALFVLSKGIRDRRHQTYCCFSLFIALFNFCYIFWAFASTAEAALQWFVPIMVGVIPVSAFFLHFCAALTETTRQRRIIIVISYVATLGFVFANNKLWLYSMLIPRYGYGWWPVITPLCSFYHLFWLLQTTVGFLWLWRGYQRASGNAKEQLRYTLIATLLGYSGGATNWFLWYNIPIPPYPNVLISIFQGIIAYAIIKHRLLDIRIAIRKSLVYSLLVTALTISYFGLVYGIERLFQVTLGYHSVWLSVAAFALMALVFQPIKIGIQRLVDRLFFHAPHEELARRMERLEQEIRQADKLKAISLLAAGMAHEIKNPLSTLKTFAEFLPEKAHDPEFLRTFQPLVTKEVSRIDHIVRQLMNFAKPAPTQLQPVQVTNLLEETLSFLTSDCLKHRVQVHRVYDCDESVQADPQQLRQVFLNLLLNSLEAMDGQGGELAVATARHNGHLQVTIEDTGPGISKADLTHVFDPFFTTKASGTGLGLSVVQGIITEHRGRIDITSAPGHGTTVTLKFPLG